MANRMIRDGILESEAVLSLPVEARWLYVSILLSADDVGLFEATPFRLARKADIRRDHAERLVQLLADADLIRLYRVDGKDYGFIPRFGQRLQIRRARCPLPPMELLTGDEDAVNKIKHLTPNSTVDHGESPKPTAAQPPEPEVEVEGNTTVAKATGAVAPKKPLSADEVIFGYGLPLLVTAGTPDRQARSFLGGLRKSHGDDAVVNALRDCIRAKPLQPLEWLAAALKPKVAGKQSALEARNAATASRWLERMANESE